MATFRRLISDEAGIDRRFIVDWLPISFKVVPQRAQIICRWVCDTSPTCLRITESFCHKNSKRTRWHLFIFSISLWSAELAKRSKKQVLPSAPNNAKNPILESEDLLILIDKHLHYDQGHVDQRKCATSFVNCFRSCASGQDSNWPAKIETCNLWYTCSYHVFITVATGKLCWHFSIFAFHTFYSVVQVYHLISFSRFMSCSIICILNVILTLKLLKYSVNCPFS